MEMKGQKEQIIISEKDCQIFFHAITHPNAPSQSLKRALKKYNHLVSIMKK